MKLKDIKKGMLVEETIGHEIVKVVSIGATKKYGQFRCIRVRFADGTTEYYTSQDLEEIKAYEMGEQK